MVHPTFREYVLFITYLVILTKMLKLPLAKKKKKKRHNLDNMNKAKQKKCYGKLRAKPTAIGPSWTEKSHSNTKCSSFKLYPKIL